MSDWRPSLEFTLAGVVKLDLNYLRHWGRSLIPGAAFIIESYNQLHSNSSDTTALLVTDLTTTRVAHAATVSASIFPSL